MIFKHHYQFQTIRPRKVIEAAKYLVRTSELFKNEGIKVGNDWLSTLSNSGQCSEQMENLTQTDSCEDSNLSNVNKDDKTADVSCIDDTSDNNDRDDKWCEEKE